MNFIPFSSRRSILLSIPALFLLDVRTVCAEDLQVLSKTPVQRTSSARAAQVITATFNQAMVPLNDPAEMGNYCPMEVEPRVKGRCRWMGSQTLSFEPSEAFSPAQVYQVRIPKGTSSKVTGSILGTDVTWQFETERPTVVTSKPMDRDRWIDLDALLLVQLNLPLDIKRSRDFVSLEERPLDEPKAQPDIIALGVRRATSSEIKSAWDYAYGIQPSTGNVLVMKPSRRLKPNHVYSLRVKAGLPVAGGTLGLYSDRVIQFETYYTFRVTHFPTPKCLPAAFAMSFSNPVKYSDFLQHLRVDSSTPIPKADGYLATHTGDRYPPNRTVAVQMPDISYEPDRDYHFTIDKKLEDIYGNALGEDVSFTLSNNGYCPSMTMPTGFGVMESYLPRKHPLMMVNVSSATFQYTRVTDHELIPFYKDTMLSADQASRWPSLKSHTRQFSVPRNVRYRTSLDMDELLPATGGFIFAQTRDPGTQWGRGYLKALDNITRIGLTFKGSPDSSLIWTSFLKTGAPAGNIPVELRDDNNRVLWQGVTNTQGFAVAPGWTKLGATSTSYYQHPKIWVFAKDPKGTAVLNTEWQGGVSPWRFNLMYEWGSRAETFRGHLFTERGVYRPGEKVYAKGLIRKLEKGDWKSSGFKTLQIMLTDARGAEVTRSTVSVSDFSSFDWSYVLKEEAPTGWWSVKATPLQTQANPSQELVAARHPDDDEGEGSYGRHGSQVVMEASFRVEAFKPASFEVKVTPQKNAYVAGDEFYAVVNGWYLFGAPMTDAKAEWKLRLSPTSYDPPGWENFQFGRGWWGREEPESFRDRLLASGTNALDARGSMTVQSPLKDEFVKTTMAAVLEASVSSPDRQRLFGRASVIVHPTQLYIGIKPAKYFAEAGKPWTASIVAVRPDGVIVAGRPVTGHLIRREWLSVERGGLSGRLEWISQMRDTVISTFTYTSTTSTYTWNGIIEKSGQYLLEVTGTDENKRSSTSEVTFYVTGSGDSWWARSDNDMIEVLPDKKAYKPGDTARIFVKSPYAQSRAMVTLEREGIMNQWLVTLTGAASFIEVPLGEDHIPNVYVGIMLVQGRSGTDHFSDVGDDLAKPEVKFGYATLMVDPGGRRLTVKLKTDKTSYRPRERVTIMLQTQNDRQQAVPAEVTVYAVDEGVLSLTAYGTPDPFGYFYGGRPLRVSTVDSRLHVIGQRSFGEKGENRGGGGGGGAALEGIDLRTRFVPTAYWNPSVKTDAQGKANVSFTLPDNLSRFRVMAVASAGKQFGSEESKLTVSKPLLLRPSLPRFARIGDTFQGGVVLHNYTKQSVLAHIGLELAGSAIQVEGARERDVEIQAGKAVEVAWAFKATALGQQTLRFRTTAGGESDGLEWKLPVRPVERLQVVATSGVTEKEAMDILEKPKDIFAELSGVTVTMSPTALAGLEEGARFLLDYPYGCLEQRLSRSLPVIVGADLVSTFKLGTLATLKANVQQQLDHLIDFQHANGGFAYWPNPRMPDPYITAYALEVSHLAGKEGYRLPDAALDRAASWLKIYLGRRQQWAYPYSESDDYAARAYVLYVLALRGQPMSNYFMELYQRRDQIPYSGKVFLFKAAPLVMSDANVQQTLANEILNQARMAPTTLHFEEPSQTVLSWIHNTSVLTTARVVQAFLESKGGFPGDEKAVQWLIQERKNKAAWRTTQENAVVLRALQDFYRQYEKAPAQFTGTLLKDDQVLWQEKFLQRTLSSRVKKVPFSALFGSSDNVRLKWKKEGTGRLYYTIRMKYAPTRLEKAAAEGLKIEKSVTPLYGKGKDLRAGARAVVTLTVETPQDRNFVAVEDPLPGGFEIVDPSFAVEGQEDVRAMEEESARGPYWGTFHRHENYDDRILLFADFLTAGTHTYRYLVQTTTPGQFSAPAATAEGMYEPEVFGHTASDRVEIRR